MKAPQCYVTGHQAGSSNLAARIARRIMNLDSLAVVRQSCTPDFDVDAFAAAWARIIDEEIRAAKPSDAIPAWMAEMIHKELS